MSAGRFLRSKYAADYGDGTAIHPIRVQPETIQAVVGAEDNDPPAGEINNPISAQISRGRRSRGLSPRFITIQLPATSSPPTDYAAGSITRIPALNAAFFGACVPGAIVEYLGVQWEVVSASPERAS